MVTDLSPLKKKRQKSHFQTTQDGMNGFDFQQSKSANFL